MDFGQNLVYFVLLIVYNQFCFYPSATATAPAILDAVTCPPATSILPCTCSNNIDNLLATEKNQLGHPSLTCQGDQVSQQSIDNLFSVLDNENSENRSNKIDLLWIKNATLLQSLNVTFLIGWNLTNLRVTGCSHLSRTVGHKISQGGQQQFSVKHLTLEACSFDDTVISDLLNFGLQGHLVESLDLRQNKIRGFAVTNGELIPKLSSLSKLEYLNLNGNKISQISGLNFTQNQNLIELHLSNQRIDRIGPNALNFASAVGDKRWRMLRIYLHDNDLSDEKIDEDALAPFGRFTFLSMGKNNFSHIGESKFRKLLLENSFTYLWLQDNPFFCDGRMQWIQQARRRLEDRLGRVNCLNFGGRSIFSRRD